MSDAGATTPGASQLLRSLGLLVDGPARWGDPPRGAGPGILIIELPGGQAQALLDHNALRRWLERVPELLLDGEQPSAAELARRLESFWLPTEPVLYVGRSPRSIAARLAAIYATPLGDARPTAAGHWLKALAGNSSWRVWWALTDAHEEYEDALLEEIAQRQPPDTLSGWSADSPVLPFGNLTDSSGRPKAHGLERSLRAGEPSGPAPAPPTKAGRRPAGSRAVAKARSATARPRTATRAASARAHGPAAPEPTYLSADGLQRLEAELEQLRSAVRPGVIARVKAARELGDLRENSEYESARKEQSFVEGRIQALEQLIKSTVLVRDTPAGDTVVIGSTVTVVQDGEEHTFELVGSSEADPAAGRISYASPVGQALLGRRVDDEVSVRLPRGEVRYVVRNVG
ncbi:MAG TPA: transcription elongation factor GreA [Candidatus Limnocylindria bacterium]|nr:transcription elongation factor GreA [Candidatus Limnocylindria bacterium]